MQRDWLVDVVQHLPQGLVSRAWGWLARRQHPKVGVAAFKRAFVAAVGIDMSEAGAPMASYPTLEDLFVRHLRNGARRIDPEPTALVSPVDGKVGAFGTVQDGLCLQVKGRSYQLAELLGSATEAAHYEGGVYATLYLAPRDYHRIHAPLSGKVAEATLIPGGLLPVFAEAVDRIDSLFARNERIITYLDTPDAGRLAVVKVGATLVGRIALAYDPTVWSNRPGQARQNLRYDPPRLLQKGSELAAFELGSTVVLVAPPGRVTLDGLSETGATVRMGQRIGTVKTRATRSRGGRKPSAKTRNSSPRLARSRPSRA